MTSLSPTTLTFEDVLRALGGPWTGTGNTLDQLVKRTGRVRSNLKRDLGKLVELGLVQGDADLGWTRSPQGSEALDAIDRANGFIPEAARPTWPLAKIEFNPDNPRKGVDDEPLRGLADSIVAAEGLLQPIVLYPIGASGARMLHAGERRVRACRLLEAEGRLPDALAAGLPFIERPASKAEALFIGLVENSQREDLTPFEDALALKAYKDETGLSARAIAFKLGRAREGSETGVRDVQEKIRVAEQATAEAIADYEAGRVRWEDLRDSIREARALSPDARLAMIELRWKLTNHPVATENGQIWAVDDGYGYQDPAYRELQQANLIETFVGKAEGVHCSMCRLSPQGQAWLEKAFRDDVEVVLGQVQRPRLQFIRSRSGTSGQRVIRAATDEGFTTSWLNNLMVSTAIQRLRNGEPQPEPEAAPPETNHTILAADPSHDPAEPALTAAQELALVELKARIVRRQHIAYGGAQVFYPVPAWAEALNFKFFSPLSDATHKPTRNYVGLTQKAEAYLREKGLWVDGQNVDDLIRAARNKSGAWKPGPLALGEYATGWLSFRGMAERLAPAQPARQTTAGEEPRASVLQPNPAPQPLLTLYAGDIVEKHSGGLTTYRLLSIHSDTGPRLVFRAQPIRNGKDYGAPCALWLNDIWAVVSSAACQDASDAAA